MDESESLNAVVFKTKVAHFRVKNTPLIKRYKLKGKVQKGAQFFFVGQGKLLVMKLSFEEFNNVFFTLERKISFTAAKFWKTFQVPFLLYAQENYVFKREFMYV